MNGVKRVFQEALKSLEHGFDLLWGNLSSGIPILVVALLLVVLGSLIAIYAGGFVTSILKKGGVDKGLDNLCSPISKLLNTKINSSKLIGDVIEWVLLIIVLIATFNLLKLHEVVVFFTQVISYFPSIFVGAFIMVVGYLLATLAANMVNILTKGEHAYLGNLSRAVIFIFSAISASAIVFIPLVGAFRTFLNGMHLSGFKTDALFVGIVVLLVFASKNTVTKWFEKLF